MEISTLTSCLLVRINRIDLNMNLVASNIEGFIQIRVDCPDIERNEDVMETVVMGRGRWKGLGEGTVRSRSTVNSLEMKMI